MYTLTIGEGYYSKIDSLEEDKLWKHINMMKSGGVVLMPIFITDLLKLCDLARRSLLIPNGGGNSVCSEALSMEMFQRCLYMRDIVYETHIVYEYQCHKFDYIGYIYGKCVAVSISRAYRWADLAAGDYTNEISQKAIRKKIRGCILARKGLSPLYGDVSCIIHFFVETKTIQEMFLWNFPIIASELDVVDEVLLVVTLCPSDGVKYDCQDLVFRL